MIHGWATKYYYAYDFGYMTHDADTRSQDDKFEHSKIGTIGVDFRFRTINVDGATIKLQIVRNVIYYVPLCVVRAQFWCHFLFQRKIHLLLVS
jgi:hypothetical protein